MVRLFLTLSPAISRLNIYPGISILATNPSLRLQKHHRLKTSLISPSSSLNFQRTRFYSTGATLSSLPKNENSNFDDNLVVLGIETSCDDTAAAVVRGNGEILSQVISSQAELLAQYGGVAPKQAEEAHSRVIDKVVQDALDRANLTEKDLSAVAVTIGPGLSLCLRALTLRSCIIPKLSHVSAFMDASIPNSSRKATFSSFAQSSRSGGRGGGGYERDSDRRRPQGRGGGGGGKDKIDALGRLLTRILRHMATELRLNMRGDGFVKVEDLLKLNLKTNANIQLKSHTIDEVREAVRRDNKQRFSLIEENEELLIRANQGHSITTVESEKLLKPILSPEEVPVCVHGTYRKNLESILASGLNRMNRMHVHFSCGLPTDGEVISGIRRNVNVLIFLDIKKALEDGIAFYISDNKVILTEGIDGVVPVDYFQKIESWPDRQSIPF